MKPVAVVICYLGAYVLLDWLSYIHPFGAFAITPWNPPPGLSLALLLVFGLRYAPALPLAGVLAELAVRGWPAQPAYAFAATLLVSASYVATAWLLRGVLGVEASLGRVRDVARFVGVAAAGAFGAAAAYVGVHALAGDIAADAAPAALVRFWAGDAVGVLVTTPVVAYALALRGPDARPRPSMESALQAAAVLAALAFVFYAGAGSEAKFFYVLFLPLVWVCVRHGTRGALPALLAIQIGVIAAVELGGVPSATLLDLQLLMLALGVTGLFLGAVVSDRSRMHEALVAREAQLARTLRLAAAAETASALAHELNQPLSAIGTYARACTLLAADPHANRGRLDETLAAVVREVGRAGDVVRRLREFFRSGGTRLERTSAAELTHAARTAIAPRLERHGIALRVELVPPLPALTLDRTQIETVLHNLLTNAVDALAGARTSRPEIVLRVAAAQGVVRFEVADTGPGLGGATLDALVQPFASTKAEGMGLGLAISRSIVENHGGRLFLEPSASGARFVFTLPAEAEELAPA